MHTGMSNSIEEVPKLVYVFWTCKPVEYAIGNFKASLMPDYALRVPLRVQAAYLPQAYKLCSVRAILSQTYRNGFSIEILPLSEIIRPPWR